jgi:hypothetical protein
MRRTRRILGEKKRPPRKSMTGEVLLTNKIKAKRRHSRKHGDPKESQRLIAKRKRRHNKSHKADQCLESEELVKLIHNELQ